jgi:hypothetical protein
VKAKIEGRPDKGSARRRLIRGAFAAPAVMTLYSGSVAAASILCTDKTPTTVPVVTTSAALDTYLRYQLYGLVRNGNGIQGGTIHSYYIKGEELKLFPGVDLLFLSKIGMWQRFDFASKTLDGTILDREPSEPSHTLMKVDQYVALRVDSEGHIVDVGSGSSGSFASESCAGSLYIAH